MQLLKAATQWATNEFGGGKQCVFASRLDLDESGAGNVDLFIAPLRENKASGNVFVSIRKAKEEMAKRWDTPVKKSYSAMQDSWHAFACKTLGDDFQRGVPVVESTRNHATVQTMRRIGEDVAPELIRRHDEELAEQKAKVADRDAYIAHMERELEATRRELADARAPAALAR